MSRLANVVSDLALHLARYAALFTIVVLGYRVLFEPNGRADFATAWAICLAGAIGWGSALGVVIWLFWCARADVVAWVLGQLRQLRRLRRRVLIRRGA